MTDRQLHLQRRIALDYFNEQRYAECYEVLERVWRVTGGPERALDQGIIQLAAGCEKALAGNWRGAVSLLDTSSLLIEPFQPAALGIDVAHLVRHTERVLQHLLALGETRIDCFDRDLLPRIQFVPEAES